MVSQTQLIRRNPSGWHMGFMNMLAKENKAWWNRRTLLTQIVLWTLFINGILAFVYITPAPKTVPSLSQTATQPNGAALPALSQTSSAMFPLLMGLFAVIGVIVVIQDSIIGEKQSQTAAWVLTKPVSRASFILAKLIADTIAVGLIIIGVQGALGYVLAILLGHPITLLGWIAGLGALFIYFLFFITLTLMLGTFFNGRSPVIGIPLMLLFLQQLILGIFPWFGNIGPWLLVIPDSSGVSLITRIIEGNLSGSLLPLLASLAWSGVFTLVAVWRFGREEF